MPSRRRVGRAAPAGLITLDQQPKTFGLFSMTLFAVSAILVADTVATSAAIGVQGLTMWVILGHRDLHPLRVRDRRAGQRLA